MACAGFFCDTSFLRGPFHISCVIQPLRYVFMGRSSASYHFQNANHYSGVTKIGHIGLQPPASLTSNSTHQLDHPRKSTTGTRGSQFLSENLAFARSLSTWSSNRLKNITPLSFTLLNLVLIIQGKAPYLPRNNWKCEHLTRLWMRNGQ